MRMRWLVVIGGMIATVGLASAASARPWVRRYPVVRVPGRVAAVTTVRAVRGVAAQLVSVRHLVRPQRPQRRVNGRHVPPRPGAQRLVRSMTLTVRNLLEGLHKAEK